MGFKPWQRYLQSVRSSIKEGRCPKCQEGKVYAQRQPGLLVRIVGQAPLAATAYELERLAHLPIPKHRERMRFTMSTADNTAPEKQDVHQRVTSQIVSAIEQGVSNWRMSLHTSGKFALMLLTAAS